MYKVLYSGDVIDRQYVARKDRGRGFSSLKITSIHRFATSNSK